MLYDSFTESGPGSFFTDLYNASTSVYVSFGMALVWSLIFIYIMSMFAEALAWCCVFLIQIGLIGAAAGSFYMYGKSGENVTK